MLKKPEVGQVVVTKDKCSCYAAGLDEGVKGTISAVDSPERNPRGILVSYTVNNLSGERWHCTKCLRRPKKGETL